jgi:hypothetical protein
MPGGIHMFGAETARTKSADARDAAKQVEEALIAEQWKVWGPEIEDAIESACKRGVNEVEVRRIVYSSDMKALEPMINKHLVAEGYRTEFKWIGPHIYNLNIYW